MKHDLSRRAAMQVAAAAAMLPLLAARAGAQTAPLLARAIPRGGETIPVVGLGTAINFASAEEGKRAAQSGVVAALLDGGGRLIDTASAYGAAESVIGDILARDGLRDRVFLATKVGVKTNAADADAEFARSLTRLRTGRVDLIQLHNVSRPGQSLTQLRDWKAAGKARFVGITSTDDDHYDAMLAIIRREKPDFVQVDYSMDNREAETRVIPAAKDAGAAVLTALPFGRNSLFRAVKGKALPEWAREIGAATWAQFFLKFLLGNAAVTAVIPGTGDAAHMRDNLGAGTGTLPDAAMRDRMAALLES